MNPKIKGYLFGATAAATYGMNPLFALPLYNTGMDANSVLFFRYLIAIPMVALLAKIRGHNLKVDKKDLFSLLILGGLMITSSITLFSSYLYMDVGIASTILFVYPVMVALIMFIFFKEKISWFVTMCIAMTVGGIGLLYKNSDGATLSLVGTLFVFASALSYAIYVVVINKSRISKVPTLKVTFYVLLVGLSVLFFRTRCTRELIEPHDIMQWLCLVALAIFPTVISFMCTTQAIHYVGSTPTAILGALEPVTAVFFGVVFFGEVLGVREIIGLVVIIVAVTLVITENKFDAYIVKIRKMFPKVR